MGGESGITANDWLHATPSERSAAAAQALGKREFASWCAAVLTGAIDMAALVAQPEPDPRWLTGSAWANWGPPSTWADRGIDYWPRTWAARGLLHQWDPCAEPAVAAGLGDGHWRVREMCAKVAAKHELGCAADTCARIAASDENHRVRAAALRALATVGEAEHAWAIAIALGDASKDVASSATSARRCLEIRLDRPLDGLRHTS